MYGVIDIGSNSIRLALYRYRDNKVNLMLNKKYPAGLAGYVNKKNELSQKGIAKAIDVLTDFSQILKNIRVRNVFAFATASLRNIENTEQVISILRESTGFDVRVLSGAEEAKLDYYGAMQTVDMPSGILVDIGGGSTELVFYKDREMLYAESMPVGSLNMFTKHVDGIIPTKAEVSAIEHDVLKNIEKLQIPDFITSDIICGVGGTARACVKLNNELKDINGENESFESSVMTKIIDMTEDDSKKLTCLILKTAPERIHTMIPGITVLNTIASRFSANSVTVSKYGVREGYLYSILSKGE